MLDERAAGMSILLMLMGANLSSICALNRIKKVVESVTILLLPHLQMMRRGVRQITPTCQMEFTRTSSASTPLTGLIRVRRRRRRMQLVLMMIARWWTE